MDVGRLGTRSLTNLAYTLLLDGRVTAALDAAEEAAMNRKATLSADDRRGIIEDVERAFDEELVADIEATPESARERAARENARAISALMQDMALASAPDE